jgi:hypothetical protein
MAAGWVTGILLLLPTIDLNKFIAGQRAFYYPLYKPPILDWPWKPWRWLGAVVYGWTSGLTFYFQKELMPEWWWGLRLWYFTITGLLIAGFLGRRSPIPRPCLAFYSAALAVGIAYLLLVRRNDPIYAIPPMAFLIPCVALSLETLLEHRVRKHIIVASTAFCFLSLGISSASALAFATQHMVPYDTTIRELRRLIPADANVIGPNTLWFSWEPSHLRDVGAWIFSRMYSGGEDQVGKWLGVWRPQYVIADDTLIHTFLHGQLPGSLERLLGARVHLVGIIDTGRGVDNGWSVFAIDDPFSKNK